MRSPEWDEFEVWARRQGLDARQRAEAPERFFLEIRDYHAVPPMRVPCPDCEDGQVEQEVTVDEVVALALAELEQPIVSSTEMKAWTDKVKAAITSAAERSNGVTLEGHEINEALQTMQEGAAALRGLQDLQPRRKDAQ